MTFWEEAKLIAFYPLLAVALIVGILIGMQINAALCR